jgi:hypothetical protein
LSPDASDIDKEILSSQIIDEDISRYTNHSNDLMNYLKNNNETRDLIDDKRVKKEIDRIKSENNSPTNKQQQHPILKIKTPQSRPTNDSLESIYFSKDNNLSNANVVNVLRKSDGGESSKEILSFTPERDFNSEMLYNKSTGNVNSNKVRNMKLKYETMLTKTAPFSPSSKNQLIESKSNDPEIVNI